MVEKQIDERQFPWDITRSDNIDRRPTDVTCGENV